MLNKLRVLSYLVIFWPVLSVAELQYSVNVINELPIIDGSGSDAAWSKAKSLKVRDNIANIDLHFQAVHDKKSIVIKINFPDPEPNLEHKMMYWNEELSLYQQGSEREDAMVIKWSMNSISSDLSLSSSHPYHADIWFWKAFRTNPLGYADDKIQIYSRIPNNKATQLVAKDGSIFFLQRKGDAGKSSYQNQMLLELITPKMKKYRHQQPSGSRADVKAKGLWQEGQWTIEFQRVLNTGNNDDIALNIGKTYLLGLSRYEIAGRKVNPKLNQPLFNSGDVSELIALTLEP